MRFAHPEAFWLLAVPLLAALGLIVGFAVRRTRVKRLGDRDLVLRQVSGLSPVRRVLKGFFIVLGFAAAVTAMARPQYGGRTRLLRKLGIDLVVALDFSKSMLAMDVKPSRLDLAKRELRRLTESLGGDRLGLVAFAGDTVSFPLTTDYEASMHFWKDLMPYEMPVGGTSIAGAIRASEKLLTGDAADARRSRVMILLTDGEDHEGDAMAAAQEAVKAGIRIYTIGIGSDTAELIPNYLEDGTWNGYQKDEKGQYVTTRLSPENEKKLQEIASLSGGSYVRSGLKMQGIQKLSEEISRMKKTELESRRVTTYEELFTWFLWPAAVLLFAEALVPERRRSFGRRKPKTKTPKALPLVAAMSLLLLSGSAWSFDLFRHENRNVRNGTVELASKKYDKALEKLDAAARNLPGDAGVQLDRGMALYGLKRYEEARQAFLAASTPDSPTERRSMAYYNLGNVHFKLNEFQDAIESYRHALRLKPGDKDAAYNLELAKRRLEEEKKKQEEKKKEEEKNKDQQKQDQQKQDQQKQQQPKPEQGQSQPQEQPRPGSQDKMQAMPLDAVLDSLDEREKSFQEEQAKRRALMMKREVIKDW